MKKNYKINCRKIFYCFATMFSLSVITAKAQFSTPVVIDSVTVATSQDQIGSDSMKVNSTTAKLPAFVFEKELLEVVKCGNAYPNPVKDKIKISLSGLPSIVSMHSSEGGLLMLLNTEELEIEVDMSEYKSGIYILQITTNGDSVVKKIIKE